METRPRSGGPGPLAAGVIGVLLIACSAAESKLDTGNPQFLPDAGSMPGDTPSAPILSEELPAKMPYPVITLRGRALDAERVFVEAEGLNPISQQVGTDGSFCIDVPAPDNGVYAFRLTAHSRGVLSAATTVMTEKDGTAPTIPGARTCSGADPFGCGMQKEICDNNRDDDCNGVSDEKDPACSGCMSDYLEPNNDQSAPALEPGTYSALYLCPGESDYYGITVEEGDRIYLKVTFLHADGNIDAEILKPDGSVVAKGDSLDDDEIVSVTATEGGEYSARVFGSAGSATSSYGLFLSVTPGT